MLEGGFAEKPLGVCLPHSAEHDSQHVGLGGDGTAPDLAALVMAQAHRRLREAVHRESIGAKAILQQHRPRRDGVAPAFGAAERVAQHRDDRRARFGDVELLLDRVAHATPVLLAVQHLADAVPHIVAAQRRSTRAAELAW